MPFGSLSWWFLALLANSLLLEFLSISESVKFCHSAFSRTFICKSWNANREIMRYMLENSGQHKGPIMAWCNLESPIPENRVPRELLHQTKLVYSSPIFSFFLFSFFLLFLFSLCNSLTETVTTRPRKTIVSEMHSPIPIILEIGILNLSLEKWSFLSEWWQFSHLVIANLQGGRWGAGWSFSFYKGSQ